MEAPGRYSDPMGDLQGNKQLAKVVIGTGEAGHFIAAFFQHVACFQKIVKLQMIKIAGRLNARQFHFDGDAAFAFPPGDQPFRFPKHTVGGPHPALHIGDLKRFKDFLQPVAVGNPDIIRPEERNSKSSLRRDSFPWAG